jgi:hypothetical protein
MRIIIHETYEYEVEAGSADEARDLHQKFMDGEQDTGVSFNDNSVHTYNENLEEI